MNKPIQAMLISLLWGIPIVLYLLNKEVDWWFFLLFGFMSTVVTYFFIYDRY